MRLLPGIALLLCLLAVSGAGLHRYPALGSHSRPLSPWTPQVITSALGQNSRNSVLLPTVELSVRLPKSTHGQLDSKQVAAQFQLAAKAACGNLASKPYAGNVTVSAVARSPPGVVIDLRLTWPRGQAACARALVSAANATVAALPRAFGAASLAKPPRVLGLG